MSHQQQFLLNLLTQTITQDELVSDIVAIIAVFWSAWRERSRKNQHFQDVDRRHSRDCRERFPKLSQVRR